MSEKQVENDPVAGDRSRDIQPLIARKTRSLCGLDSKTEALR